MKIVLFEDEGFKNFLPLVYLRPVWDLRCGALSLRKKIEIRLKKHKVFFYCRDYLQKNYLNPDTAFDLNRSEDMLFLNGRILGKNSDFLECLDISEGCGLINNNNIVAFRVKNKNLQNFFSNGLLASERIKNDFDLKDGPSILINYPWDLIYANGSEIRADIFLSKQKGNGDARVDKNVNLLAKENIYLASGTRVMPGVTINAEDGPVWIDEGATIMPHAVLQGPLYIGKNSTIKTAAKIWENTTIGPVCKVGGDVEESIILAYSNKQHEGFLGHSYLGEWINIGADTNNSDLKNNYGEITVLLNGYPVNTGKQFMGLIMGDHSKTAINTMFNTGTVVGINCNIFGAGFPPKFIPSFSWGGCGELRDYLHEKAIEVAKLAMARRQKEFTQKEHNLFKAARELANQIEKR
jgi:UDP-N-acetylglucosamine diphosphorylase/glucosamine-1-phosphate N-acetyltransferase